MPKVRSRLRFQPVVAVKALWADSDIGKLAGRPRMHKL